jgi:hypothetical protein
MYNMVAGVPKLHRDKGDGMILKVIASVITLAVILAIDLPFIIELIIAVMLWNVIAFGPGLILGWRFFGVLSEKEMTVIRNSENITLKKMRYAKSLNEVDIIKDEFIQNSTTIAKVLVSPKAREELKKSLIRVIDSIQTSSIHIGMSESLRRVIEKPSNAPLN